MLQFVEPNKAGEIITLELGEVSDEEFARFKKLVSAVWQRIQVLDFPDTSEYEQTYSGVLAFEEDLIAGSI